MSLEARRQALVAESDLNRTELAQEWSALKFEAARLANPARKAGRYLSSAVKVVGVFMALRRVWSQSHGADGKRNWFSTLLQTARVGISLWPAFRFAAR